jgi:hypothetical protein
MLTVLQNGGREMSDEQINMAIAKACGWYEEDNESEICWTRRELTYCLHEDELPEYCNDLNAMHEAEKTIRNDKWKWLSFCNNLDDKCENEWNAGGIHATARQRAEAFLRTLGKWEGAK